MEVAVLREGKPVLWVTATSLEVARMVATSFGFEDVDVEPGEPGRCKVTATGPNKTVVANGTSAKDACQKLIELLTGER